MMQTAGKTVEKTVRLQVPPKLIPVFDAEGVRYRGAYGGRGSAKTRTFAKMTAVRAVMFAQANISGVILCGREYQNSLDESSMAEVKGAIASEPFLAANFDVGEKYIRTKCGRVSYVFAGLRKNIDSIKSKARILILWIDEAEPVSEDAWQVITPTVRETDSEIWVTWNPLLENSATDKRFRQNPPDSSKIVEMNYTDNPWFPDVLEMERLEDQAKRPDDYGHIWLGEYKTAHRGAYLTREMRDAQLNGRISRVAPEGLLPIKSFHDIGGAGAKADAYTIWVVQFVNREIRVLDYYEAQGQTLDYHVAWMRQHGYETAEIILPHDGANTNNITGKRYEDHWRDAGFQTVKTVPNQGTGAAMQRVEAVRRIMPLCWFNENTTQAGRRALSFYHEKIDTQRNIGLGPEHDWSSHAFDAFGLMAIDYKPPRANNQNIKVVGGMSYQQGSTNKQPQVVGGMSYQR